MAMMIGGETGVAPRDGAPRTYTAALVVLAGTALWSRISGPWLQRVSAILFALVAIGLAASQVATEVLAADGVTAQTIASSVMLSTAYIYAVPVSTTHVITSSVMGVGATRRLSAVRWGVAGNILVAWVLTIPMAGLVAAVVYWVVHLILE